MNTPNEILINIWNDEMDMEMMKQHKEEQRAELNADMKREMDMERESYEC